MTEEVTDFEGVFCKDADAGLIKKLKQSDRLIRKETYEHSYPFCWRCDTPLLYYARDTWFIEMTRLRDNLMRNNATVNWIPENIRDGRFGKFLENVRDWGISRERYWGTPLPIWQCECGHRHMVGSIAELKEMAVDAPADIELHKPYIDAVHLSCPQCQKIMTRVSEVIDCWFDSGSMPFAQWHYPFENKEAFQTHFPADFISEAIDQTRGWFYTLMAISTLLFDESPYRNVIVLGLVQDKDGQKMSKHKGNVVDPWQVLDQQGADAVRWYFYTASSPWLPSRFAPETVSEAQRKFMNTLWNTYAFYIMYANIDDFDPSQKTLDLAMLGTLDRWILSRLNSLIGRVCDRLDAYDITTAARAIQDFVEDLSNWYVRRSRERFWQSGHSQDKENAYLTLYTVLESLTRLCAPFVPFMSEAMYQNLRMSQGGDAPQSVHLGDYPHADETLIDTKLEEAMADVLQLVVLGRSARNTAAIKNRQPLQALHVVAPRRLSPDFEALVADELNVKKIIWESDEKALQDYHFKPQLRTLGRRFGPKIPALTKALSELDGREAMASLQAQGQLTLDLQGETVELSPDDLLIETVQAEGLASESDRDFTVALDTTLTEALREEGFVREIISKVQTMRKDSGFEVQDRILLRHRGNANIAVIVEKYQDKIAAEVLADRIEAGENPREKKWDLNGETCFLSVEKVR